VGSGASGGRGGLAARFLLAKTWPQGHFAFLAWTLASQAGHVFCGPRPLMVGALAVFSSQVAHECRRVAIWLRGDHWGCCAELSGCAARFGRSQVKYIESAPMLYAASSALWRLARAHSSLQITLAALPSDAAGAARFSCVCGQNGCPPWQSLVSVLSCETGNLKVERLVAAAFRSLTYSYKSPRSERA